MPWFKVNDTLPMSRKVLAIPRRNRAAAMGLWVLAGAWAASELTDGHVPGYMVDEWADEKASAALVKAGLWDRDESGNGFRFHDWKDWQPTKGEVEARRVREREKKAQQRSRGAGSVTRDDATGKFMSPGDILGTPRGHPGESPGVSPASPSRPVPSLKDTSDAARSDDPEGFAEFWSAYPRKEAKRAAVKAYRAALKRATAEDILKGAKRYAATRPEPRFTAMGATWLNADRWEDSPVSNNNAPSAPGAATRRTANGVTLDQW